MTKRISLLLCFILTIALMTPALTLNASAAQYKTGECTYTYANNIVTVTGTGVLNPWPKGYFVDKQYPVGIVVGEGITELGEGCFEGLKNVESVTLPSTLKVIGGKAFRGTGKLKSITLPSALERIGPMAFGPCGLTGIEIPASVKELGSSAFEGCSYLSSVTFQGAPEVISYRAFYECKALRSITLPEGLRVIGSDAFSRCPLESVAIPASVETVDPSAFNECREMTSFTVAAGNKSYMSKDGYVLSKDETKLVLVPKGLVTATVPEGVKTMEDTCFDRCLSLTRVSFPDSLQNMSGYFRECSYLEEMYIGSGATSIKDLSFTNLDRLKSIQVSPLSSSYASPGGLLYTKDMTTLIMVPRAVEGAVTVPEGVTALQGAFHQCHKLTSVTLPDSLTVINGDFYECPVLANVELGSAVTEITNSFSGCKPMRKVVFPASLKTLSSSFRSGSPTTDYVDMYFMGDAPERFDGYFNKNTVLYYRAGAKGWTSPEWNGFKTALWEGESAEPKLLKNFSLYRAPYTDGKFTDVNDDMWYGANREGTVKTAFRLGLVDGKSDSIFDPEGGILLSEAIKLAAVVHSVYNTGVNGFTEGSPWYQVYADYAVENGIIAAGSFPDLTRPATRAEMAHIFSRCVPASELAARATAVSPPDVSESDKYGPEIFLLYRAGVISGNDAAGTFYPAKSISRAEAAAIISRIVIPSQRT